MSIKEKNNIQVVVDKLTAVSKLIKANESNCPNDKILQQIENYLGFKLPEDYIFLIKKIYNLYYGTLEPFIVTNSQESLSDFITSVQQARDMGVPKNWLPICEDNGDYYCLLKDGSVRFWDHNGATEEKWTSLAEWVDNVWIQGH